MSCNFKSLCLILHSVSTFVVVSTASMQRTVCKTLSMSSCIHEPCLGETWRLSHAKPIQAIVFRPVSMIAGGEPTICPFRTQFVPVGVEYFSC
jgi:hypothetical protein